MILDLLFIFPFFFLFFTFCLLTFNFFSIHKCSIAAHSQHAAKQGFISTTEKQNKVIYYFFSFFSFFNRYKKINLLLSRVGVTWHLRTSNDAFYFLCQSFILPSASSLASSKQLTMETTTEWTFSRGCSFHRLEVLNGKRQIVDCKWEFPRKV